LTLDRLGALNRADPNDIMTGRLELRRAGVLGISLGGIVAGEACPLEPRLRACLVMPTCPQRGPGRPPPAPATTWISRDADAVRLEGWFQADLEILQTTMRAVFERKPGDGYLVLVPGMFHLNLTDLPLWSPLTSRLGLASKWPPSPCLPRW
jgi:hypothetical protein